MGATLHRSAQASHYHGLSFCGAQAPDAGSVIVAHGPSCSAACGIFPDQGSNPCPLHWQADSQPLRHQGSPRDSGSIERPTAGFPPPSFGLYPIPEKDTLRFQIIPPATAMEASFPSEYSLHYPPGPSVSLQNLQPVRRGKGKDSRSDPPRSLRGQDRSRTMLGLG